MMELPGARPDWEILTRVARVLGLDWRYGSPAEILAEIGRVVPLYAGVSRRGLASVRHALAVERGRGWREWQTIVVGSEPHLGDAGAWCGGQRRERRAVAPRGYGEQS